MGLITETIPNSNVSITETIPINVTNVICTDGSSSNLFDIDGVIDGTIYRVLCMQDDMKFLDYPDRIRNEFDLYIKYAEEAKSGKIDSRFLAFDTYLGSIGVGNANIC